jgi:hypothetical protein
MPMFIDLKHWNLGFGQTKLPVTVSSKLIGVATYGSIYKQCKITIDEFWFA